MWFQSSSHDSVPWFPWFLQQDNFIHKEIPSSLFWYQLLIALLTNLFRHQTSSWLHSTLTNPINEIKIFCPLYGFLHEVVEECNFGWISGSVHKKRTWNNLAIVSHTANFQTGVGILNKFPKLWEPPSTHSPHHGRSFPPLFVFIRLIGNSLAAKSRSEAQEDNR